MFIILVIIIIPSTQKKWCHESSNVRVSSLLPSASLKFCICKKVFEFSISSYFTIFNRRFLGRLATLGESSTFRITVLCIPRLSLQFSFALKRLDEVMHVPFSSYCMSALWHAWQYLLECKQIFSQSMWKEILGAYIVKGKETRNDHIIACYFLSPQALTATITSMWFFQSFVYYIYSYPETQKFGKLCHSWSRLSITGVDQ